MCTHYKIGLKNPLAQKITYNTNMGIDFIHQKALIWFSIFQMIHTQYVYFPEIYLSMVACNFSPHRLASLWYSLHIFYTSLFSFTDRINISRKIILFYILLNLKLFKIYFKEYVERKSSLNYKSYLIISKIFI